MIRLLFAFSVSLTLLTGLAKSLLAEGVQESSAPNVKHLIDTHIHIYDTDRGVYKPGHPDGVPWPPASDKVLHKPQMPAEYRRVAKPAGVTGVVVVEASPRVDDNRWVLDLVENDKFFVGLVGNLNAFEESFGADLDRLRKDSRFVGVRVHLMGKGTGISDNTMLLANLKLLADADLTVDILMNGEGPETIDEVDSIAGKLPKLRVVVNHVLGYDIDGKLPGKRWVGSVKNLAARSNVWVKISGLYQRCSIQPAPHDIKHYDELLNVLWEEFGDERLIYGSNWPCTKKSGDYASFVQLVDAYFAAKGQPARERFFWQNAADAYKLGIE